MLRSCAGRRHRVEGRSSPGFLALAADGDRDADITHHAGVRIGEDEVMAAQPFGGLGSWCEKRATEQSWADPDARCRLMKRGHIDWPAPASALREALPGPSDSAATLTEFNRP
jgi:hypothetical protein